MDSMSNGDNSLMLDEDNYLPTWGKPGRKRRIHLSDKLVARAVVNIVQEPRKLHVEDYKKVCLVLHINPTKKNIGYIRNYVKTTPGVKFEIGRLHEIRTANMELEQLQSSLPLEPESDDIKSDNYELSYSEEIIVRDPSSNYLTSKDLFDLSSVAPGYIRKISNPFGLDLYTDEQVNVVQKEKTTLHLSGSSTLIPWNFQSSPIHYYIGVIRTNNADFPIFEFMTETRAPLAIQGFLNSYLAQVNEFYLYSERSNHPFTSIVVDFNATMLNGVLGTFNWEDLLQYTNRCFTDGHNDKTRLQVHVCFNDFMRCLSFTLWEHQVTPEASSFVLNAFAWLANARTLDQFETIFKGLIIATCSEYVNEQVEAHQEPIRSYLRHEHVSLKLNSDNASNEDFDQIDFHKSPYYRKYSKMFRAVLEEIKKMEHSEIRNKMYYPGFMKATIGLYMAYPNLWSMFAYRSSSDALLTNDSVERYIMEMRKEYFTKKTTNICTFIEQRKQEIFYRDILIVADRIKNKAEDND